jgi:hypothetical protein
MNDDPESSTITLLRTQAKTMPAAALGEGYKSHHLPGQESSIIIPTYQTRSHILSSRPEHSRSTVSICVPPPPSQPAPSASPLLSNIARLPLLPASSASLLASSLPPAPLWQALLSLPELPLAPSATFLPESVVASDGGHVCPVADRNTESFDTIGGEVVNILGRDVCVVTIL